MNFAFSEEQEAFRETLRRFCDERLSVSEVRRLMETPEGYDRGVWKQMAQELGLQGLVFPEAYGGQGFGFLELGIALEEMGRQLGGGPYFATVCLGGLAILNAGDEEAHRAWLPGIASGDRLATLALLEASGLEGPEGIGMECRRDGSDWRLSGRKSLVLDGQNADLIVVAARQPGSQGAEGISLFGVERDAGGVSTTPVDALDPTRKLADLDFDAAPARLLGAEGEAWPTLSRTLDQARVALSAEMVGGAARCLESAVAYAKVRVQFAQPIGSFQAIKHKAAEVLLEVESARSIAYWAWWVASQPEGALAQAASLAKSFCGDAYQRAAAENLHIHGGIGVTWEHDAQLYFKRAAAADALFGDASFHRARLAEQLGL